MFGVYNLQWISNECGMRDETCWGRVWCYWRHTVYVPVRRLSPSTYIATDRCLRSYCSPCVLYEPILSRPNVVRAAGLRFCSIPSVTEQSIPINQPYLLDIMPWRRRRYFRTPTACLLNSILFSVLPVHDQLTSYRRKILKFSWLYTQGCTWAKLNNTNDIIRSYNFARFWLITTAR